MIRSRLLASLLVLEGAALVIPAVAHAQSSDATATAENARARDLFRQGAAAMKDGKFAEARKALLDAWSIRHTYDVAAILGQAELELKLYRDAAEHLEFAIDNFAPRESAETLEKVKTGLQTARQHVAELRISVSEPGADVTVDGHELGKSPLPSSVFVESGDHRVEARLDDDRVATRAIEASVASAYTIELTIPPQKAAAPASGLGAPPAPDEPAHDSDQSTSPSLVPVAIGGGLVVVGLAMGVGYRIAASSSEKDRDALRSKNGPDGCATGAALAVDCSAQKQAADNVDSRRNLSTAGFVVAGAAALGTAIYWFWPRSSAPSAASNMSRFLVSGVPTPGGGSVMVSGSF